MAGLGITRVILYVKDVAGVAAFYERHFGLRRLPGATEEWVELAGKDGGCGIAVHLAAKSQKSGSVMKVVFGVEDVEGFKAERERDGLRLGVVHRADGVEFANGKDPAGNSIQISNRGIARKVPKLAPLVSQITPDNRYPEVSTGPEVGKEEVER
jgi:catechol 2,3-dioxygenase-like lactoylglutathione lyase family enzyme